MSGIPIRRDRFTDTKKTSTAKSFGTIENGKFERRRATRKKSVEDELRDENAKLKSEKTSKQNSIIKLERDVERLQETISDVKKIAEEKENLFKAEIDDLSKKNLLYADEIESYNKKLLLSNINPATMEPLEIDEEQKRAISHKQEMAKVATMEPLEIDEEQKRAISHKQEMAKDNVKVLKKRIEDFSDTTTQFLQNLKAIFKLFDKDNDGYVNTEELEMILRSLGHNPSEKDIKDIVHDIIVYGGGKTSFSGFLDIMKKRMKETDAETELREAFKVFDQDGNGLISASELRHIMLNLGEKLSDEEVTAMIKEADKDGDGQINYNEFVKMMTAE